MDIDFLSADSRAVIKRKIQGLPPLPLTTEEAFQLIQLCKNPPENSIKHLRDLLRYRITPGANQAAYIKANFLADVAKSKIQTPLLDMQQAIEILGTMWGGYNIAILNDLLDCQNALAQEAYHQLRFNVFLFDTYYDIAEKYQKGHVWARRLLPQWAQAQWLHCLPCLPDCIQGTIFKIPATVNAAVLSPIKEAWTRSDIALHAQSFLKTQFPNFIKEIAQLKKRKQPIIFVADQITLDNTSAVHCEAALNVLSWVFGEMVPFFPNRAQRGITISQIVDTNFRRWAQYNGALSIEADTHTLETGDVVQIYPYENCISTVKGSIRTAKITQNQLESWQVGGYLNLQLGRALTQKARNFLQSTGSVVSCQTIDDRQLQHYSLAQKMIGYACELKGIKPMHYCEPSISIVEAPQISSLGYNRLLKLPYTGLSAELVIEPFQHPHDTQSLPLGAKGAVILKPGDGMVHAWLNRLSLPGEIGIGKHIYTGLVTGLGFAVEQALIPEASCTSKLPIIMPESVLIKFSGVLQPGITIRDLVYAIPYVAKQKNVLIPNEKYNIFTNRIIEITGLPQLTVEQSLEFNEACIDWGSIACVVQFSHSSLKAHVESGIKLLCWMIQRQYHDVRTLRRRVCAMQAWLRRNEMLDSDLEAEYAAAIDIDLNKITEPLVASLETPKQVQPLSAVANTIVKEAFVGGFEISVSSYRVVGELVRTLSHSLKIPLWLTPASKLEASQLMREGYYALYANKGVRTVMPDNNLCMSTQIKHSGTIVATARRAFLKNTLAPMKGYLCSPELATVTASLGHLPNVDEYRMHVSMLSAMQSKINQPIDFYA